MTLTKTILIRSKVGVEDLPGESKVGQFDASVQRENGIIGADVPVHDVVHVQIIDGVQQLPQDVTNYILRQFAFHFA